MIAFFLVTVGVAVVTATFGLELSHAEYWDRHGLVFLLAVAAFPRLTLLLSGVAWGGIFWWLSWFFVPRMLVAVLATLAYWRQNPILVVLSWLIAFGGESSEKMIMIRRGGKWGSFGGGETPPGVGGQRKSFAPGEATPKSDREKFEDAEWVKSD